MSDTQQPASLESELLTIAAGPLRDDPDPNFTGKIGCFNITQLMQFIEAERQAAVDAAVLEAVDNKLATLAEVVPYMELCETDSDRILTWVKNHRWSLIAPAGKDTQAQQPSKEKTE